MPGRPLAVILLVAFVDLASFGLIIPLQAEYSKRLGASGSAFGLLVATYAAAQLVFSPLLGRLSDRVGRRPVLLVSIFGSILAHLFLGLADIARSFPLLFVARALDGVTGGNISTAQAYIADVTTPEHRARGMGLFGAAFGVGFVVGPCLGGLLLLMGRAVTGVGTSWPAFGAAAISAVAFVLVLFVLPESRAASDRRSRQPVFSAGHLRSVIGDRRLAELFALLFVAVFSFGMLELTFVYLLKDRFGFDTLQVSLLFAYLGLIAVVVQGGVVGRLARLLGEPKLLAAAPALLGAGFMGIASVFSFEPRTTALACLLGSCLLVGGGQGLLYPSVNSLISRRVGADAQGGTMGLSQGLVSLARVIAPPIAGLMYDLRPELPYWTAAGVYLLCLVATNVIRKPQEAALRCAAGPQPTGRTQPI